MSKQAFELYLQIEAHKRYNVYDDNRLVFNESAALFATALEKAVTKCVRQFFEVF